MMKKRLFDIQIAPHGSDKTGNNFSEANYRDAVSNHHYNFVAKLGSWSQT